MTDVLLKRRSLETDRHTGRMERMALYKPKREREVWHRFWSPEELPASRTVRHYISVI